MDFSPLKRDFYTRAPVAVAPDLLGKLLVVDDEEHLVGLITEVEAYGGDDDPASHAYKRKTARNQVMHAPPGSLYVYRSYGIHWCMNVVAHVAGVAGAVLIRGCYPVRGIARMQQRRSKARTIFELSNGPGKVTQALGITGSWNGEDVVAHGRMRITESSLQPKDIRQTPRIGISQAQDFPWRFLLTRTEVEEGMLPRLMGQILG